MILLDTHTWLWLFHEPDQLSIPAQAEKGYSITIL